MPMNVEREVAALRRLSVGELKTRFAAVFGESTRANNRTWLVRRIAWRVQAAAEGGLTDAARVRAEELAGGADLQVTAPDAEGRRFRAGVERAGGRTGPAIAPGRNGPEPDIQGDHDPRRGPGRRVRQGRAGIRLAQRGRQGGYRQSL